MAGTVIAYKHFMYDMVSKVSCMRFEKGRGYHTDAAEYRKSGFHAYLDPEEALALTSEVGGRYFLVRLSGTFDTDFLAYRGICATDIELVEEVDIAAAARDGVWWRNEGVLGVLPYSEGLCPVSKGGVWVHVSPGGEVLKGAEWEFAGEFSERRAVVKKGGLFGHIAPNGRILPGWGWDYAGTFRNGFSLVRKNGKWSCVDTEGRVPEFGWHDYACDFSEGFSRTVDKSRCRHVDVRGMALRKEGWAWADGFREGFAAVKDDDGGYNYTRADGTLLFSEPLDYACPFDGGRARICYGGAWMTIGTDGAVVEEDAENTKKQ